MSKFYMPDENGTFNQVALTADLTVKQNVTDNSLTTTSKTISGAINELGSIKQDASDSTLTTTSKTVVGAINELDSSKQDNLTFDSTPTASSNNPVTSGGIYSAILASQPKTGTINISTTWTGTESPYTQTVTVSGATITSNSRVDIQASATLVAQMLEDGCTNLYIDNNSGTLTLYCVGEPLTVAQNNVQVSIVEVQ